MYIAIKVGRLRFRFPTISPEFFTYFNLLAELRSCIRISL